MAKKTLVKTPAGGRQIPNETQSAGAPSAASAAKATIKAQPAKTAPTPEDIARRAFEIYMGRGQAAGREMEDWAQAERELLAEAHRNN